jgi:Heterokaryon incompatibility protein (HET)
MCFEHCAERYLYPSYRLLCGFGSVRYPTYCPDDRALRRHIHSIPPQHAEQVIIWHGVEPKDSHLALSLVKELSSKCLDKGLVMGSLTDPNRFKDWTALFNLCKRGYWTRAWIRQEVVCASQTVHLGESSMSWMDFNGIIQIRAVSGQ